MSSRRLNHRLRRQHEARYHVCNELPKRQGTVQIVTTNLQTNTYGAMQTIQSFQDGSIRPVTNPAYSSEVRPDTPLTQLLQQAVIMSYAHSCRRCTHARSARTNFTAVYWSTLSSHVLSNTAGSEEFTKLQKRAQHSEYRSPRTWCYAG